MKILAEAEPWGTPPVPIALAIGVFDGVHRGHGEVAKRAIEAARSTGGRAVAVTFDRHPQAVVAPAAAPPMIYPLWRRLAALEDAGLDGTLVFEFTDAFARQSAADFVGRLLRGFGRVTDVCVGTSFVFGHRRSGDLELLRSMGRTHGFEVSGMEPVEVDGEVVSSTRIRDFVAAGTLDRASAFLGRNYGIAGEVVSGDRIGRTLGFPTANLVTSGLILPPAGVHAAWVLGVPGSTGERHAAAVNIGRRPTIDGGPGPLRVEAHLPGYSGDLYGARLEVELGPRLRGEVRFPSRDALVAQIREDVSRVLEWAGNIRLPPLGTYL